MKPRLSFIEIMYGIGAILVVFGHSHPLHADYPEYIGKIISFIYVFHMPLFFFISGILISYTYKGGQLLKKWIAKVIRLGIPYIVLTAIAIMPKFLLDGYMNDDMEVSFGNMLRILLIPRENIWGHFWFIPVFLVLNLVGAIYYGFIYKLREDRIKYRVALSVWGGYFS